MKTAMQELIFEFEEELKRDGLTNDEGYVLKWALYHAKQRLEKEKDQIIQAVEDTRGNIVPKMFINKNLSGEEYYNETYNQNK